MSLITNIITVTISSLRCAKAGPHRGVTEGSSPGSGRSVILEISMNDSSIDEQVSIVRIEKLVLL
jgi:hypothetical protein